jgi:hypothetical protein
MPVAEFIPAPTGTYPAVLAAVKDLGDIPNPFKEGETQHKVLLSWQIDKRLPDERPFLVSRLFTLSLHSQAALRQMLDAWIGPLAREQLRGFDLESLIGKPALVSVNHNVKKDGAVFANAGAVLPLPKGMTAPQIELASAPRKFRANQPAVVVDAEVVDGDDEAGDFGR